MNQAELFSGHKNDSEYLKRKRNLMHGIGNIKINERLEKQAPACSIGLWNVLPNWPAREAACSAAVRKVGH